MVYIDYRTAALEDIFTESAQRISDLNPKIIEEIKENIESKLNEPRSWHQVILKEQNIIAWQRQSGNHYILVADLASQNIMGFEVSTSEKDEFVELALAVPKALKYYKKEISSGLREYGKFDLWEDISLGERNSFIETYKKPYRNWGYVTGLAATILLSIGVVGYFAKIRSLPFMEIITDPSSLALAFVDLLGAYLIGSVVASGIGEKKGNLALKDEQLKRNEEYSAIWDKQSYEKHHNNIENTLKINQEVIGNNFYLSK